MKNKLIFRRDDINFHETLFKYRNIYEEYHKKLLFEQELYFPSLDYLNDPFEGHLPIQDISEISDEDIIETNIKIFKYNNPNQVFTEETLNALKQKHTFDISNIRSRHDSKEKIVKLQNRIKQVNNAIGILSLSIDPLNYLMWSHYANSHKGFCIGFDHSKLKNHLDLPYPLPISYQEEMPCWKITESPVEYAKKYLATKGILWEYEQEIRFLSRKYINEKLRFDINIINCVFLGYKMEDDYIEEIVRYFNKNNPSCNIYKIQFASNLYDLEGVRIN